MRLPPDLPLRRKLALVALATTCGALLLAFLGQVLFEAVDSRARLVGDMSSLAEVVAAASAAALEFHESRAATEALAILRAQPSVVAARIYAGSGRPLSSYGRGDEGGEALPREPAPDGHSFDGGRLTLVRGVPHGGERIGTVAICADLSALLARRLRSAAAAALILALAGGAALAAARRLAARVTAPLLELEAAARRVSETKDFSVRVPEATRDEIGNLATAFNAMISEIEARDEKLRHLALHDALTGLPNRVLLTDRLSTALARARRHGGSLAVMFLDLDNFKLVNDSLGHAAGDQLLRLVAGHLRELLREEDTIARTGGDEFVVLLPGLGEPGAAVQVAERILDSFLEPFHLAGAAHFAGASIGISLHPLDGRDAETLVAHADVALYRAKEAGRSRYQLYTPALQDQAIARMELERSIRLALLGHEFRLAYQPVVEAASGRVVRAEALLRWHAPGRDPVPPGEFLPVAEECGLIEPLGRWVLESACQEVRRWHGQGLPDVRVSVNLSSRQLRDPALAQQVEDVLAAAGLDAASLEVEITETTVIDGPGQVPATLERLRAMGIRIALDDFGTGASSLAQLRRFPLDVLKMDRSFVRDVESDPKAATVSRSVVALAHGLGLEVVAEGVETAEQRDLLVEQGYDGLQGYLVSPPLPPDELVPLLLARRSVTRPAEPG